MTEEGPWRNPSIYNKILGTLCLLVLFAVAFQDLSPHREASTTIVVVLGTVALTLLGFGALIRYLFEVYYGG